MREQILAVELISRGGEAFVDSTSPQPVYILKVQPRRDDYGLSFECLCVNDSQIVHSRSDVTAFFIRAFYFYFYDYSFYAILDVGLIPKVYAG